MLAIRLAELGSIGSWEISVFQALFGGKGILPSKLAPGPYCGAVLTRGSQTCGEEVVVDDAIRVIELPRASQDNRNPGASFRIDRRVTVVPGHSKSMLNSGTNVV